MVACAVRLERTRACTNGTECRSSGEYIQSSDDDKRQPEDVKGIRQLESPTGAGRCDRTIANAVVALDAVVDGGASLRRFC